MNCTYRGLEETKMVFFAIFGWRIAREGSQPRVSPRPPSPASTPQGSTSAHRTGPTLPPPQAGTQSTGRGPSGMCTGWYKWKWGVRRAQGQMSKKNTSKVVSGCSRVSHTRASRSRGKSCKNKGVQGRSPPHPFPEMMALPVHSPRTPYSLKDSIVKMAALTCPTRVPHMSHT